MRYTTTVQRSTSASPSRAEKTAFLIEQQIPDFDAFMQAEVGDLDLASKGVDVDSMKTIALHCLLIADCRWEGADYTSRDDEPDTEPEIASQADVEALKELLASVLALYGELKVLPPEELDARYELEMDEVRPFARNEAAADFERWLQLASWTPDEATALSFGKDPECVQLESLVQYAHSPFANAYRDRFSRIEREALISGNNVKTDKFQDISRRIGFLLPQELQDGAALSAASKHDIATKTLQDALLAIAIRRYELPTSWNAQDEKTTVIAQMTRDMASLNYGLEPSDKTLRDHLKAAMVRLRKRAKLPTAEAAKDNEAR